MTTIPNQSIYRFYAPVYDWLFRPVTIKARSDTVGLLALQQGERLLIPGVGTGLDLPLIPPGVRVTAGDISSHMLRQAQSKTARLEIELKRMDAQHLEFADGCFDAVLFTLVLSVVPDARAAFGEAWRVLRPGGRIALFDKFIPEGQKLTLLRRLLGKVIGWIGTDPNRRLSEILDGWPGLKIERNESSLLSGQRREVEVWELVPGDLVLLVAGEKAPADGEIVEATRLSIDEALLTGESEPVNKQSNNMGADNLSEQPSDPRSHA